MKVLLISIITFKLMNVLIFVHDCTHKHTYIYHKHKTIHYSIELHGYKIISYQSI